MPRKLTAPRRRCLVEGGGPKARLLRWRLAGGRDQGGRDQGGGKIEFDPAHNLAGRGFYLCPDPEVIGLALRKNLFAKAARRKLTLASDPAAFIGEIEQSLIQFVITRLAAAKRGGLLRLIPSARPNQDTPNQVTPNPAEPIKRERPGQTVWLYLGSGQTDSDQTDTDQAGDSEAGDTQAVQNPDDSWLELKFPNHDRVILLKKLGLKATDDEILLWLGWDKPTQGMAAQLQIVLEQLKSLRA
ncbi:MAG: DUF448 domain-containing protein [Candidatus Symbiobacter sp.]|nr:DUF448 domain-containing protein [Candidatus Symbiobacter sp.]